jgi:beta-galactosidase
MTISNEDSPYFLDFRGMKIPELRKECVKMGTSYNQNGDLFEITNKFLVKNKQPWIPVMGEFHYARYSRNEWENEILKMKAGGIEVIATYIFWIHHEEEKGKWNWEGNRDLHFFASLCAKHHLYLFVRMGPWCHGEVRNGGHPDWILKEGPLRQNKLLYVGYARELYRQIHEQLKGMYFKEGGTIIGAQIENERTFNNPTGLEYMLELKKIAQDVGIDVPYYVATGWQGYDGTQKELIPMWGAYPDAPWASGTDELVDNKRGFHFSPYLHESDIGNDLLPNRPKMGKIEDYAFPFLTVEMGAGTQCTHHRRPIFNEYDGASLINVKIGSGANGIGYYVFHGGSNPIGNLSTLQESKASHYPNDLPIISYDFYAPIGEWGQIRPSYKKLKQIHFLIQDFGHNIATYPVVFPKIVPNGIFDQHTLRWVVRTNGQEGFVFINNYQRHLNMDYIQNVQFHLCLSDGQQFVFPEKPITIPRNTIAVLPFNLMIDGVQIVYSTVQPFCILNHESQNDKTLVMHALNGINAEILFSNTNIKNINGSKVEVTKLQGMIKVHIPEPNYDVDIKMDLVNGSIIHILVLSEEIGLNSWKLNLHSKEILLISESEVIATNESVQLVSTEKTNFNVLLYPSTVQCNFKLGPIINKTYEGVFVKYKLEFPKKEVQIHWEEVTNCAKKLEKSKAPTRMSPFLPIRCYPLYDTVLSFVKGASYWKVTLPNDIFEGVSNIFLSITYEGDTQAAYIDNQLISDNFYAGEPMIIGLRRFESDLKKMEIILLITPLKDLRRIYLEKSIKNQYKLNLLEALIKSINVIPQYKAEFTI